MKFHLGSQPYKIFINGQLLKIQQLGYLGAPEKSLEEYTLTVYWRPGVQDVIVNRTASQNSEAPLTRLYSGDTIYAGDILEISASGIEGYTIKPYQQNTVVAGNTEIYVEPVENSWLESTYEVYLPNGSLIGIIPSSSDIQHVFEDGISITADFNLAFIWDEVHWGDNNFDLEYITRETPLDIYEMPTESWFYDLQEICEDNFEPLTGQQQAECVKQQGTYLGTIWFDCLKGQDGSWYITYKKPELGVQELQLDDNHAVAVSMVPPNLDESKNFISYLFTADFVAKYICQDQNWGYGCISIAYPISAENTIDIYELDTYDDAGYADVQGVPADEAAYIRYYGQYISSIYFDGSSGWQVIYKEDLANG